MARLILVCGKICAGKTTYSKRLMGEIGAARLNADEIMLSVCGEYLGGSFDRAFSNTMDYLFRKSAEMYDCGVSVIMDCGFWKREMRERARNFYADRGIRPEWHYLDITDAAWERNLNSRRMDADEKGDYHIDENILAKFRDPSDVPSREEIDVWIDADIEGNP